MLKNSLLFIVIAILGSALYINTFQHDFALDDVFYVTGNAHVKEGINGIPALFNEEFLTNSQHNTFKLYRPITAASYAIDYSLFSYEGIEQLVFANKMHGMNVVYYFLALLLTVSVLQRLFSSYFITIVAGVLFACHPIHTEVVANIKSRDEILAYIGIISTLHLILSYWDTKKNSYLIISCVCFWLSLGAKESAILFLGIIPILGYFQEKEINTTNWKNYFKPMLWLLLPTILFLVMRHNALGEDNASISELDNVLIGITDKGELLATKLYIVGMYLYKLIVPHPLCYDYSINHITKKTFTDWQVWVSLATIIGLSIFTFRNLFKKNEIALGIFFTGCMLALTSNLFITIGATFGERFLFTPSLGFAIAAAFGVQYIFRLSKNIPWEQLFRTKSLMALGIVGVVASLYSFKTITRNAAWKDNDTLFATDYATAPESIRIQQQYASTLVTKARNATDIAQKKNYYTQATDLFEQVINTYPTYVEAYVEKGIAHLENKECLPATQALERAVTLAPEYTIGKENLALAYNTCNQYTKSITLFQQLLKTTTPEKEVVYLKSIGIAYINIGKTDSAEYYLSLVKKKYPADEQIDGFLAKLYQKQGNFEKSAAVLESSGNQDVESLYQLAYSHLKNKNLPAAKDYVQQALVKNPSHDNSLSISGLIADKEGNYPQAIAFYTKAIQSNGNNPKFYFNLGNTYMRTNQLDEAINSYEKAVSINPNYDKPYSNLILAYQKKNNTAKVQEYQQKLAAIVAK